MKGRSLTFALAIVAILAVALPASAQLQRGAIYGTVVDNTGAVLPGVTVTLTSNVSGPQTTVSGSQGEFRFGELDPGVYTISASLQGFAPYKRENIIVNVGSNIQLPVQMALQGVKQEVTVTAATPVLNEREHGNTTTFGDAVINEVPTARDPWVLLQQVPGVLVDRINVGGSESGQQSTFTARGDNGTNTMWNIDGVTITDMAAIGSSPTYYNFDVFQEVQFSTGGTDPRQQTGALGINMVTKRGTNDFHGLARYFFDNNKLQGENIPADIAALGFRGNRINQISDYGGDIGGPIIRNKLWFWGSLARNDIRQFAITGAPDNTRLDTASAKIDFQATPNNHADFFYYRGQKVKIGRNAGVTRPPETTWNQTGPTDIYKFEDSHTFGSHLLLTGRYAHVTSGFSFQPQGGLGPQVFNDADAGGIWHGSYFQYATNRPQDQVNADGNYFRGMHELKFGFQYRRTPVTSTTQWSGNNYTIINATDTLGLDPGTGLVTLTRPSGLNVLQQMTSFYGGDTIGLNRFTIDLALRYDRQNGYNRASSVSANPLAPALLPEISFPNQSPAFTWDSWSPRAGVTMRVNDKTNVRASYAMFQGQLPNTYIASTNPVQLAGATYVFTDNGTHTPTTSNVDFSSLVSSYGFDPSNPTLLTSPNTIDPNLKAPRTHSVIVALDRELLPNFALSTSFGWARTNDVIWQQYPGLTSADFVVAGSLDTGKQGAALAAKGLSSTTPFYALAPGVTLPPGALLTNRPGYHQRYWNWDITATKRLSNHWMFRGYVTLDNNQEFFDNPALAIQDPTALAITGAGSGGAGTTSQPEFGQVTFVNANLQGGIVPTWGGNASGGKQDVYMQAKWSYSLMGLYQFPLGINASGTMYGRQGYPNPLYLIVNRGGLGSGSPVLLNQDLNANRNPNVHIVDLRAEKSFTFRGVGAIASVDLFNAFNNATILQYNRSVSSSAFLQPRELVAPRIVRFGVRLQF